MIGTYWCNLRFTVYRYHCGIPDNSLGRMSLHLWETKVWQILEKPLVISEKNSPSRESEWFWNIPRLQILPSGNFFPDNSQGWMSLHLWETKVWQIVEKPWVISEKSSPSGESECLRIFRRQTLGLRPRVCLWNIPRIRFFLGLTFSRLWNTRRAIWDLAVSDLTAALSSFIWTDP